MKPLKFIPIVFLFFFSSLNFANPLNNANVNSNSVASIVLVGDSITQAWPWQELLAKSGIVNRGISGDTSFRILQRMDGVLSVKPKKAFLMFGINDFGAGFEPDQVFSNYEQIVRMLQNEKIRVIISSTIKCNGNHVYNLQSEGINKKVDQLNAKLKNFSRENGITFVDVNEKLSDANGLKQVYTMDGVHLNYEAYKEWAKLLSPMINEN